MLCAHGGPGSGPRLARRAAELGRRGGFAEAAGALLYGTPHLEEVAARLQSDPVCVVPLFLSAGHTFGALRARLADLTRPQRFRVCPPLGAHRGLAAGLLEAIRSEARKEGWRENELALVLAAHGSSRGPASRDATLDLAREITEAGSLGHVTCGFLEEPPALDEVLAGLKEEHVLVAGCFAEEGRHARGDVPDLIARSGRTASYLGPIAAAPWSDELILDTALRSASAVGPAPPRPLEEPSPWRSHP